MAIKLKNQEVAEGIVQYIVTNNLEVNDIIPSEKQLRELFSVSRVTVRSAISLLEDQGILKGERGRGTFITNLPDGVDTDKTLSKLIGFVCYNGINSPFMSAMIRGAETGTQEDDYHICLSSVMGGSEEEARTIRKLLAKGVDGLIVAPVESNPPSSFLCELAKSKTRLVVVDENIDEVEAPSVLCDDRKGGFMATEALIDAGHKRIAHIGGPYQKNNAHDRFDGYKKALQRYSIEFREELVPAFDKYSASEEMGRNHMRQLLQLPKNKQPTAIFAANDSMAIGAWNELVEQGYSVPGNFSIIGYGNEANLSGLSLSSVDQNPMQIGRSAWDILKKLLDGDMKARETTTMLRPEIVIRASVSKPANDTKRSV